MSYYANENSWKQEDGKWIIEAEDYDIIFDGDAVYTQANGQLEETIQDGLNTIEEATEAVNFWIEH